MNKASTCSSMGIGDAQPCSTPASSTVRCIFAHDDETFTYNKRINHLATIQEHFMIVRALARGVSEEKTS